MTNNRQGEESASINSGSRVYLDGLPWNRHVFKLFEKKKQIVSGAHVFIYSSAPGLNPERTDPELTFGVLDPADIPQLEMHRGAPKIRERLDEGHLCRVAKDREGKIEQVLWCANRPYLCWPVRTMIDPGPRGWYIFDTYTPPHARRKGRYAQNLDAWRRSLAADEGPIVGVISPLNTASLAATPRVGLAEIARVCCVVSLGCKLYRFTVADTEISRRWYFRPPGKHLTLDAPGRRIY